MAPVDLVDPIVAGPPQSPCRRIFITNPNNYYIGISPRNRIHRVLTPIFLTLVAGASDAAARFEVHVL